MTIGTGGCAAEVLLALKPKKGEGGLTFVFDVKQWSAWNDQFAETVKVNELKDQVQFSFPERLIQLHSGLAPTSNASRVVLAVANELVCEKTGKRVKATFAGARGQFTMTVTKDLAPESCGNMFWDPVLKPVSSPFDGTDYSNYIVASSSNLNNMHVVASILTVLFFFF